jgi:pimeloyl-ACP methyl ester carboxylesterase
MKNLRTRNGRLYWHWDPRFIDITGQAVSDGQVRLVDAARRVTAPTLLVRGDKSDIVRPDDVPVFLSLIPTAKVIEIAGVLTIWSSVTIIRCLLMLFFSISIA